MRAWSLILLATVAILAGLLFTTPALGDGRTCPDPTIVLLTAGSVEDRGVGGTVTNLNADCSEKAWGRIPYLIGVAVVGVGLSTATRKRSR